MTKTDPFELLSRIHAAINQYRLVDRRGAFTLHLSRADAQTLGEARLKGLGCPWKVSKKTSDGLPFIKPAGRVHA